MSTTTRKSVYPDATTVIAIAGEMAVSVRALLDNFAAFAEKPAAKPIAEDLRRIGDTALLISLRAVTRVGADIVELARRVETGEQGSGQAEINAIHGGLEALHRYLTSAAGGRISSGLLLHPAYAEVMRCMPGRPVLSRGELFLPVTPIYGKNSPTYNEGRFVAEIARYHDEFQRSMLLYTTKRDLEVVNTMRTTLVTMEAKNPPANFRMFFSLAISYLDIAMRAGGRVAREDEPLLGRINRELMGVVRGEMDVEEATISWLMYVLAQAQPFSVRVRTYQETYDLRRMIEEDLGGVISEQTLASAEAAVISAQKSWEAAMSPDGDAQAARGSCIALAAVCNTIGDYSLKAMSMAMGSLADHVASGTVARNRENAVFGASVLIAIAQRVERVTKDPRGGKKTADFHKERVRAVLSGKKPSELPTEVPEGDDPHSQGIVDEILNELSAAEQIIEQCLRDGAKGAKVDETAKLFAMVQNALAFVNLPEGSLYAQTVAGDVDRILTGMIEGRLPEPSERSRMAEAVMLLQRFISLVNVDRRQALSTLEAGVALYAPKQEPVLDANDDAHVDICHDEELGPIFFEEAKSVIISNILPGLVKLRTQLGDEHTMLEVRRGFHTLKGSARMIELNNLGMLAQHAEYTLNVCRDRKDVKPSIMMLDWLDEVARSFEQAVIILEQGKPARTNPDPAGLIYQRFADTLVFSVESESEAIAESVHIPETSPVVRPLEVVEGAEVAATAPASVPTLTPSIPTLVEAVPAPAPIPVLHTPVVEVKVPVLAESVIPPSIDSIPEAVISESVMAHANLPDSIEMSPSILAIHDPDSVDVTSAARLTGAENEQNALAAEAAGAADADAVAATVDPVVTVPLTAEVVPSTLGVAAETVMSPDVPETPPVSVSPDVKVGSVTIPTPLYNAFVAEARKFFTNLEDALRELMQGKRQDVDYEMMRMAHSLAGMGRTTGLIAITQLCGVLEDWINLHLDRTVTLDNESRDTLRDTLEALDAMVAGVEECIEPAAEFTIIARLRVMLDRAEHEIAHAADASDATAVSESMLERIEAGALISDEGATPAVAEVAAEAGPEIAADTAPAVAVDIPAEPAAADADAGPDVGQGIDADAMDIFDRIEADIVRESEQAMSIGDSLQAVAESLSPGEDLGAVIEQAMLTAAPAVELEPRVAETRAVEAPVPAAPPVPAVVETVVAAEVPAVEPAVAPAPVVEAPLALADVPAVEVAAVVEIPAAVAVPAAEAVAVISPEPVAAPAAEVVDETLPPTLPLEAAVLAVEAPVEAPVVAAVDETPVIAVDPVVEAVAEAAPIVPPVAPDVMFEGLEAGLEAGLDDEGDTSSMVVPPTVQADMATLHAAPVFVAPLSSAGRRGYQVAPADVQVNWVDVIANKVDDVDDEMLGIFSEEATDRFEEIDTNIAALAVDINDKKHSQSLKRAMHTLKGSANTAGARKIGALFHTMEDMLTEVSVLTPELMATVQSGVDAAFAGFQALRDGRSVEAAIIRATRHQPEARESVLVDTAAPESVSPDMPVVLAAPAAGPGVGLEGAAALESTIEVSEAPASVAAPLVVDDAPRVAADVAEIAESSAHFTAPKRPQAGADPVADPAIPAAKASDDETTLRVPVPVVDNMARLMGEINIARTRVGLNVDLTKNSHSGLAVALERLYGYLRQIELEAEKQMFTGHANAQRDAEFDALQMDRFTRLQELTRRVAEAWNDVLNLQGGALAAVRDMEEAIAAQGVLVTEVSSALDRIRQVRVASIVGLLKRTVRAAVRDSGKRGEIYFDADVEIDRGILDRVTPALEHLLRNAVAHGIESPADRRAAGKDEVGTIEFSAHHDGGEIIIEIRDDGRGIDTEKIRAKAIERGLLREGAQASEEQLRAFLFEPGFTTADEVSALAGRGVGLDVVRSDIAAMGGGVYVSSLLGQGSSFTLRVPATMTMIAGAAATTNGHMYVIPVVFIDRLIRISGTELETAYRSRKLVVQEASGDTNEYEFYGLWNIAGADGWDSRPAPRNSVLLMRNERVAIHVDDVRPAQEYVFRPMGPQIAVGTGLIGSTINAAGNAALVIDPSRIVRSLRANRDVNAPQAPAQPTREATTPLVLIVDDSLTVRKVTSRLLKKEGLRSIEAENGMQALERVNDEMPDVILMDIEMPVMNGYEATQALRATPATAAVPIIMITSRAGETHKKRAFELGVNEYVGKPYNESDLIDLIRKYLAQKVALSA